MLILADDLGYGELGCQGNKEIPTPHIDSLAAGGTRFTSGYVSAPVCSPARAGLLTGRYGVRYGIELNPGFSHTAGLPLTEKTLAERLKPLGYATGIFGKWHLGFPQKMRPLARGFDEFYGYLGPAHNYLQVDDGRDGQNAIMHGQERVASMDYLTDAIAHETVDFIDRHQHSPWFAYVSFSAVHGPLDATEKYTSRFAQIADPKRRLYAAVEAAMDDAVGLVLAKLRALHLEEQTLIVFLSDNGAEPSATTSSNKPLRGTKGDVWEGGIRIPFIVQWKGHLPAGKVDDRPIIQLDILPTAVAAAGGSIPAADAIDGVNLLPYLSGENAEPPHAALYWRYSYQAQRAIRMGDWKLVGQGKKTHLFNLAQDIAEANDLAAKEPAKVQELEAAYQQWNAQIKGGSKTSAPAAGSEEKSSSE